MKIKLLIILLVICLCLISGCYSPFDKTYIPKDEKEIQVFDMIKINLHSITPIPKDIRLNSIEKIPNAYKSSKEIYKAIVTIDGICKLYLVEIDGNFTNLTYSQKCP